MHPLKVYDTIQAVASFIPKELHATLRHVSKDFSKAISPPIGCDIKALLTMEDTIPADMIINTLVDDLQYRYKYRALLYAAKYGSYAVFNQLMARIPQEELTTLKLRECLRAASINYRDDPAIYTHVVGMLQGVELDHDMASITGRIRILTHFCTEREERHLPPMDLEFLPQPGHYLDLEENAMMQRNIARNPEYVSMLLSTKRPEGGYIAMQIYPVDAMVKLACNGVWDYAVYTPLIMRGPVGTLFTSLILQDNMGAFPEHESGTNILTLGVLAIVYNKRDIVTRILSTYVDIVDTFLINGGTDHVFMTVGIAFGRQWVVNDHRYPSSPRYVTMAAEKGDIDMIHLLLSHGHPVAPDILSHVLHHDDRRVYDTIKGLRRPDTDLNPDMILYRRRPVSTTMLGVLLAEGYIPEETWMEYFIDSLICGWVKSIEYLNTNRPMRVKFIVGRDVLNCSPKGMRAYLEGRYTERALERHIIASIICSTCASFEMIPSLNSTMKALRNTPGKTAQIPECLKGVARENGGEAVREWCEEQSSQ